MFSPRPTREAQDLQSELEKLGIYVIPEDFDGYKHVDLKLPKSRICIEVDGDFHLTNPDQIEKDLKRNHYSDRLGFDTIHIPNHAIHENLITIAQALQEVALRREKKLRNKFLHKFWYYRDYKSTKSSK